jgi:hypothetical protein
MGYRSDVLLLVYADKNTKSEIETAYAALKTLMNTAFKEVADMFHDNTEWIDRAYTLKFMMEDVKWYESYPDVQAFMEMTVFFRDESHGYCTEFIRIGEEIDDVEEMHTGENQDYRACVERRIECNL